MSIKRLVRFRWGGDRRHWLVRATVVVAAVFSVVFVAASGANLAGSLFEGSDGNMVVDTPGNTDWASLAGNPGLQTLTDLGVVDPNVPDNSFGQGASEDDPDVTIVTGSIPPNKNDLTRSYIAGEQIGGQSFLYLAWERAVNIGSATIDFELNQQATSGWTDSTTGPVTINRSEGDLLITYSFSGSGTPTIGMLQWLTDNGTNSSSSCFKSGQTLPCWGNEINFDSSIAEAAVNTGTIDEPLAGGTLTAGLFGEASINLTAALESLNTNTCRAFGSVFVKSRSSGSSFDSELKDFIAPAPIHVANCPAPTIGTTIYDKAGDVPVSGPVPLGSTVYDTAQLGGLTTGDPTGTLNFTFFDNGTCLGDGTSAGTGVALDGQSSSKGPLAAGDYSFRAQYIAGPNDNYVDSRPSACEPLTVDKGTLTLATTIHAAGHNVVGGAAHVPLGSVVHDNATIRGANPNFAPTGAISFTLNGNSVSNTATAEAGFDATSVDSAPLAAGSDTYLASIAADSNYKTATSDPEPLTVDKGTPSIVTVVKDANGATVDNANPAVLGSKVHDTSTLSGGTTGFSFDGTATVTYELYASNDCSGTASTSQNVTVNTNGTVPDSADSAALAAGSYSYQATYNGNANYQPAAGTCEPFKIGTVTPSVATTLKNAATDATIANGTTLPHGSSVYDTASITSGDTFPLTGTVTFRFFHNGTCTGDPASPPQTGVAAGDKSAATGALDAGSYAFQAMYVAGDDPNHTDSAWSSCEPFTIAPLIDLAITKTGSPNPITIGQGNITWTMVVTNNGPDTATGVTVSDPLPAGNTFVSVSTTKGTCTGGAIINCTIGTMAAGESATITLVTTPTVEGTVTNTVKVVGNEAESNTANNTASASVVVEGFTPPVYCVAVSRVTPKQLFVGRKTKLTIHVTQHGKAVKGIRVRIKGPKVNVRTKASNSKGVIKHVLKMKKAGVLVFTPIASSRCNTQRVGVTNVFTPPVTG